MPTASTTLQILVQLKDEASAAMQGLGANLQSVGESMTSVGKTMTTDITLPLVAFATYAVKGAMDFQQAMTLVQTQAGASATEIATLSTQVMQLATVSQQGPTVLAQGLYHLVSLGLDAQDAMSALKIASEGAAVGQANLEDVATALGGAISSGIKGTSDYAATMGILNATVGAGNMKMTDLVAALGTGILPAAKSAGLSIQDVSAALATMTDNGIPAADAATRLRMTFSLMAAPTSQAQKALQGIGISSTQLANDMRQPNGLLVAIQDLQTHLEDSGKTAVEQNAVIAKAFGGGRTSSAIETLLEEIPRLQSKYTDLAAGINSFGSDVTAQNNTWSGQLALLNSNFQVFRDSVGKSLLEIADQILPIVTNALQDLVGWWNKLSPGIQTAIVYVGIFAAILGPVIVVIGTLVGAIGTIITAIGAIATVLGITSLALFGWIALIAVVIVAVAALGYAIYTHWTQISDTTMTVWNKIKNFLQGIWDWITALFNTSLDGIETVWKAVWDAITGYFIGIWDGVQSTLTNALSFIRSEITAFVSWASSIFGPVLSAVNSIGNAASGFGKTVGGAVSSIIPKFASGGIVNGPTIALIGEAGPEAVIPLSMLGGGSGGSSSGGVGGITVNISGGQYYTDRQSVTEFANQLAKIINQQLRLKNYQS